MEIDNPNKLEVGTLVRNSWEVCEILKPISGGYIVLSYSTTHYNYNVEYLSFENIVSFCYEITTEGYEQDLFNGENIENTYTIGHFKPKEL